MTVVALGGAVAVHHMPVGPGGMGHMHVGAAAAMAVCLAVLPVAAAAGNAPAALLPRPTWTRLARRPPATRAPILPPQPRARASPVATVVLRR